MKPHQLRSFIPRGRRFLIPILLLLWGLTLRAGTNGSLEGTIKDKRTGEVLPGVNVMLVGLRQGTSTSTDGFFIIQNIRAGRYDLRCTHVGYRTMTVRSIVINPDMRTRVQIEMEPADVELNEITVVQEKPVIQGEITGTTYLIPSEEIAMMPVDQAVDVIRFKPSVTAEGNVRGGKSTEVLYLVDGLPVQDVLTGGMSSQLPSSSIIGLTLFTGGFEAQYGNALSGLVNMVTKSGTDRHEFVVRADYDYLFRQKQSSKKTNFELSASGPILPQKVFYLAALNGILTDTRWWQDFQYFTTSPVDRLLSGFGKVDVFFTPTLRLGIQGLFSDRHWRDYEFDWRYNLNGLPPESRTSNRIAAIISHTVSDKFYYTASVNRYYLHSRIGEGLPDEVLLSEPYQYDFFLRYIVSGERGWWSSSTQESYMLKFDGSAQIAKNHLFRFGAEFTQYGLNADVIKVEPRKTYFGKPLINEPQLNFSTAYSYRPRAGGAYVQSKIDLLSEGLLLNFGLRYDFLDPTASRPRVEAIPVADSAYTFSVLGYAPARWKQQVSPRFGAAMPFSERLYFLLNVGWYFQYPLFDYLYSGLDRVALAKGISALTGNPDLDPERSQLIEFCLKYAFPMDIVGSITYFRKRSSNLVDSKTFIPGDSKLAGSFGFAEYVNNPSASANGVEIVFTRDRGEWLTGEVSYTYLITEGTSGSASDEFYRVQYGLPSGQRAYPLSWDQRHTVKSILTLNTPWEFRLTTALEWHSGRPYTSYPTATGFEPVVGGRFSPNNRRMPSYFNLDVRAEQRIPVSWWPGSRLSMYIDSRNLLNTSNVMWIDSNGRIGGELDDPSGYWPGRRTSIGVRAEF